ncbi:MAG: hypothetical protein KBF80_05665 [Flavobacteriales bacterium]|nr:hypothetical protein [Flavobacteriales bacterium]
MKTWTLFSLLLLPFSVSAQQDSIPSKTGAVPPDQHTLSVTAGTNGLKVKVENADTNYAQKGDTIRITSKRKLIRIITTPRTGLDTTKTFEEKLADLKRERRNLFCHWVGLEFGINSFVTTDGRIGDGPESGPLQLNNARSRFFAMNFWERKIEFGTNHMGLFTGIGIEFNSYKLSENNTIQFDGDSTWAVAMDSPDLRKNKLRQIGLRVPLMLEFNTNRAKLPANEEELNAKPDWSFSRKHNFHLAAGVVGSWLFDTMYKQKYTEDGHMVKQRSKDHFNLLPYRVAARAQIGYGPLNLFAEYALTPMFEEGTAPDLRALNVGVTVVGFN